MEARGDGRTVIAAIHRIGNRGIVRFISIAAVAIRRRQRLQREIVSVGDEHGLAW
jgi:hypothetical protein